MADTDDGISIDDDLTGPLLDPSFYAGDPFPHYARLRTEAPVARNHSLGFWVVSRHADVISVSRDPETFCSRQGIMVYEIGSHYETPPTMMHTDPPDHTRYRDLVQSGFRPSFIRSLEDPIRRRTNDLVDRIQAGQSVDIVSELAVPLPLQVISDLLGIPEAQWPKFFRWSEAVIPGATDWPEEERQSLKVEMVQYLLAAAAERREHPGNDIISELGAAEVDGDQLSQSELAMFLVQLLVAGNETTRNMISGGLVGFAEAPGQWEALRQRRAAHSPRALPIAVEEMLRWTTPVVSFMRTATCPCAVGGQQIAAGDPVVMLYASANRDEEAFGPTAAHFDAARDPNPQVSFGFGIHFCIGAVLARLEGRILLEALLDRFGTVASAGPVVRTPSPVIAGVRSAPLIFQAST